MIISTLQDVKRFAKERHADQQYAGQPYAFHLERVEIALITFGYDSFAYRAAAWLHDTVEDTDTTIKEIENRFGSEIARLVWSVTGIGPSRKFRNAHIYEKLGHYPPACALKVADRMVNHATSLQDPGLKGPSLKHLKMYLSEREDFQRVVKNHINDRMWDNLQSQYSLMLAQLC